MRRPGEYAAAYRDGYLTEEMDCVSCAHCNCTVFLVANVDPTHKGAIKHAQPHWASDGMGVCLQCCGRFDRGLICPACEKEQYMVGRCVNFEKRLEMRERRSRLVESILGVA